MKHEYLIIILVLVAGYLLGAKFPSYGNMALSKVGL